MGHESSAGDRRFLQRVERLRAAERRELELLCRPEGWPRWAGVAARFPLLSARDHVMVLAQRPGARLLLSAQQWREVGRWPRRGEEAVRLWREQRRRSRSGGRGVWALAPLFDADQTDGEPLIMMPPPAQPAPGRAPRGMAAALGAAAAATGCEVRLRPATTGRPPQLDPSSGLITADPSGDDADHCAALLAVITGAAAAHTTVAAADREAVAAAAAAVVLAAHGQPTGTGVRPDPAWGGDHRRLCGVLTAAAGVADTITATLAMHAVGTPAAAAGDPMPPPPRPAAMTGGHTGAAHV